MFLPDAQSVGGEQTKQTTAGRSQSVQSHNLGMKRTKCAKHGRKDESTFDIFLIFFFGVLKQSGDINSASLSYKIHSGSH